MGKKRVIVVSDKDNVEIRERLKEMVEESGEFEIVALSRLKVSRVRSELAPPRPDVVLVSAFLYHPEELLELAGFIRRARRHLPDSTIFILHAPLLLEEEMEPIFKSGVDAWVDERTPAENFGRILSKVVAAGRGSREVARR
ncbi:hypothetical protein GTO10_01810 [Candidatus Saccharibacteria bacterium]|nr:hypothetical protein [Candidatus Saccharibacteria bacterium]